MPFLVYIYLIFLLFLAYFLSYYISLILIKIQKNHGIHSIEREYLFLHQKKSHVPLFGGVAILISLIITTLMTFVFFSYDELTFISLLTFVIFFSIGFLDDLFKLKKGSKGLSALVRLFLETLGSLLILFILDFDFKNIHKLVINNLNLGYLTLPFLILIFVFTSNSVNFTDGLDGLASGLLIISFLPLLIFSLQAKYFIFAAFIIALIGSLLGFLFLNLHPAKIFLGDGGSLGLGGVIVVSYLILNKTILLPLSMLLFFIETLSIIIQVFYFKLTKKRVFLMAPLHHHYELLKVEENRIVLFFYYFSFIIFLIILIGGIR